MFKTSKFISFSAIFTIALSPLSVLVSCSTNKINHYNILPTYTGQADQLIALGVEADYYPTQLNQRNPYQYLTNPEQYMILQNEDFKTAFSQSVNALVPKVKGPSWWNQDAKEYDDSNTSNAYWQKQEGSILLYEHYLLDDNLKIINESWAPKHKKRTAFETNFRTSRDPFTRLPKGVFLGWDLSSEELESTLNRYHDEEKDLYLYQVKLSPTSSGGYKYEEPEKLSSPSEKQSTNPLKYYIRKSELELIESLKSQTLEAGEGTWTYNDRAFVDYYHRMFIHNLEYQNSAFVKWMIDSTKQSPFTISADLDNDRSIDAKVKSLFDAATYTIEEVNNKIKPDSTTTTNSTLPVLKHHPIYEQQEGEPGRAPMFEGAIRDNQLYLFDVAWQLDNLASTGSIYGKEYVDSLPEKTPSDASTSNLINSKEEAAKVVDWIKNNVSEKQYQELILSFDHANLITQQLYDRMAKIRQYFIELDLVAGIKQNGDEVKTSKTFGIFTLAPSHGTSTIQSMSKYSFLYKELGFAQPLPLNNVEFKNEDNQDVTVNLKYLSDGADAYLAGWKQDQATKKYYNEFLDSEGKVKDSAPFNVKMAVGDGALFNMDDNGWFWTLGSTQSLQANKVDLFAGQFDIGLITAREPNYQAEIAGNKNMATHVAKIFSTYNTSEDAISFLNEHKVDYDIWNEGLKTPFVMHMLLDQIIFEAEKYVATRKGIEVDEVAKLFPENRQEAIDWGTYFTNDFINKK